MDISTGWFDVMWLYDNERLGFRAETIYQGKYVEGVFYVINDFGDECVSAECNFVIPYMFDENAYECDGSYYGETLASISHEAKINYLRMTNTFPTLNGGTAFELMTIANYAKNDVTVIYNGDGDEGDPLTNGKEYKVTGTRYSGNLPLIEVVDNFGTRRSGSSHLFTYKLPFGDDIKQENNMKQVKRNNSYNFTTHPGYDEVDFEKIKNDFSPETPIVLIETEVVGSGQVSRICVSDDFYSLAQAKEGCEFPTNTIMVFGYDIKMFEINDPKDIGVWVEFVKKVRQAKWKTTEKHKVTKLNIQ